MKRFVATLALTLLLALPLMAGLACKVDTPAAPQNFGSALETIVAANPSFTPTPTPTVTNTPTATPTLTVTPTPTP